MPDAKNGERPYLAVPEPGFLDPKIRSFSSLLLSDTHSMLPNKTHQDAFYLYAIIFYFKLTTIKPVLGKVQHYYHSISHPLHNVYIKIDTKINIIIVSRSCIGD